MKNSKRSCADGSVFASEVTKRLKRFQFGNRAVTTDYSLITVL